MLLATWALALTLAPLGLAADDWNTREAAYQKCRAAGPICWPLLTPLASSENPEVRQAARTLLRPRTTLLRDAEAIAAWLDGPAPTDDDYARLHADAEARYRLSQAIRRAEILDDAACAAFGRRVDGDFGCYYVRSWTPDEVARVLEDSREIAWLFDSQESATYAVVMAARSAWNRRHPSPAPAPREAGEAK